MGPGTLDSLVCVAIIVRGWVDRLIVILAWYLVITIVDGRFGRWLRGTRCTGDCLGDSLSLCNGVRNSLGNGDGLSVTGLRLRSRNRLGSRSRSRLGSRSGCGCGSRSRPASIGSHAATLLCQLRRTRDLLKVHRRIVRVHEPVEAEVAPRTNGFRQLVALCTGAHAAVLLTAIPITELGGTAVEETNASSRNKKIEMILAEVTASVGRLFRLPREYKFCKCELQLTCTTSFLPEAGPLVNLYQRV